jgi:hypothetical protein
MSEHVSLVKLVEPGKHCWILPNCLLFKETFMCAGHCMEVEQMLPVGFKLSGTLSFCSDWDLIDLNRSCFYNILLLLINSCFILFTVTLTVGVLDYF